MLDKELFSPSHLYISQTFRIRPGMSAMWTFEAHNDMGRFSLPFFFLFVLGDPFDVAYIGSSLVFFFFSFPSHS